MNDPHDGLNGGCLCGAVRYRLESTPVDAGYCHCQICRRSTGVPPMFQPRQPAALYGVSPNTVGLERR
jgi:hypothetical protein